jgi:kumamolisin
MTNDTAHGATSSSDRRAVPGSDRAPVPGAEQVGELTGDEQIQVTLVLRRRAELPEGFSVPISKAELAEKYGADPADIAVVTDAVVAFGARVVLVDAGSRRVLVSGAASALEVLFGTKLGMAKSADQVTGKVSHYRARAGGLSVPAALDHVVTAVLGLDDRPQARTRVQVARAATSSVSYSPLDLAKVYKFPAGTDGSGQTIAIIELGGGFG